MLPYYPLEGFRSVCACDIVPVTDAGEVVCWGNSFSSQENINDHLLSLLIPFSELHMTFGNTVAMSYMMGVDCGMKVEWRCVILENTEPGHIKFWLTGPGATHILASGSIVCHFKFWLFSWNFLDSLSAKIFIHNHLNKLNWKKVTNLKTNPTSAEVKISLWCTEWWART